MILLNKKRASHTHTFRTFTNTRKKSIKMKGNHRQRNIQLFCAMSTCNAWIKWYMHVWFLNWQAICEYKTFFFHQVIMAKELAQTNTAARKKRTSCKAFMSSSYQNSVSLIPSPHLHRLFIVDCQWTLKKVRIYPSLNEFCWLAALDSACLLCTTQQKKTFFWMYDFDSLTITNCFRRGKNDHRYTNECKLFENRNEAKFTFDIEKWDVKLNINQVEEKMYNSLSLTIENPLCWEEEREASKNYCLIILSFTFFFQFKKK